MEWNILIGGTCSVIGAVVGYIAFLRTHRNDAKADGHNSGMVMTELGYIKSGIDDIKTEQREQRSINTDVATRLAKLESSASQAHKRIDRLEGREERD